MLKDNSKDLKDLERKYWARSVCCVVGYIFRKEVKIYTIYYMYVSMKHKNICLSQLVKMDFSLRVSIIYIYFLSESNLFCFQLFYIFCVILCLNSTTYKVNRLKNFITNFYWRLLLVQIINTAV